MSRDEVVKQMIIHGLINSEIKQQVLSRTGNDELPTLAELVNYIAAEEILCSESLSVHSESNTVGHVRQRKSVLFEPRTEGGGDRRPSWPTSRATW